MGETAVEKIFAAHALEGTPGAGEFGTAFVDRVLLNDVSGPLAFRQLATMGAHGPANLDRIVLVNDHFVPPKDLLAAANLNVMRQFAEQHGIAHFYDFNTGGIEHTLLIEEGLVGPGDLIAGGDSHTCTYGAVGALGIGLGSTDM